MALKSRSKKIISIMMIIVLIGLAGYFLFWLRRYNAPQVLGEALLQIKTDKKIMALTFDDGPNPEATEKIINLLHKYHTHATFFLVGQNAAKYPELVKKVYLNGNEIGNHSWSHERLIYRKPGFVRRQIKTTDKLIRDLGYNGAIYFRAPYGHKLFVLPYILMKMNRINVLWSLELDDWDSPPPEKMLQVFDNKIKPGMIVLLHDGYTRGYEKRDNTVAVVEMILDKYTKLGYRFVTISELLTYTKKH